MIEQIIKINRKIGQSIPESSSAMKLPDEEVSLVISDIINFELNYGFGAIQRGREHRLFSDFNSAMNKLLSKLDFEQAFKMISALYRANILSKSHLHSAITQAISLSQLQRICRWLRCFKIYDVEHASISSNIRLAITYGKFTFNDVCWIKGEADRAGENSLIPIKEFSIEHMIAAVATIKNREELQEVLSWLHAAGITKKGGVHQERLNKNLALAATNKVDNPYDMRRIIIHLTEESSLIDVTNIILSTGLRHSRNLQDVQFFLERIIGAIDTTRDVLMGSSSIENMISKLITESSFELGISIINSIMHDTYFRRLMLKVGALDIDRSIEKYIASLMKSVRTFEQFEVLMLCLDKVEVSYKYFKVLSSTIIGAVTRCNKELGDVCSVDKYKILNSIFDYLCHKKYVGRNSFSVDMALLFPLLPASISIAPNAIAVENFIKQYESKFNLSLKVSKVNHAIRSGLTFFSGKVRDFSQIYALFNSDYLLKFLDEHTVVQAVDAVKNFEDWCLLKDMRKKIDFSHTGNEIFKRKVTSLLNSLDRFSEAFKILIDIKENTDLFSIHYVFVTLKHASSLEQVMDVHKIVPRDVHIHRGAVHSALRSVIIPLVREGSIGEVSRILDWSKSKNSYFGRCKVDIVNLIDACLFDHNTLEGFSHGVEVMIMALEHGDGNSYYVHNSTRVVDNRQSGIRAFDADIYRRKDYKRKITGKIAKIFRMDIKEQEELEEQKM